MTSNRFLPGMSQQECRARPRGASPSMAGCIADRRARTNGRFNMRARQGEGKPVESRCQQGGCRPWPGGPHLEPSTAVRVKHVHVRVHDRVLVDHAGVRACRNDNGGLKGELQARRHD